MALLHSPALALDRFVDDIQPLRRGVRAQFAKNQSYAATSGELHVLHFVELLLTNPNRSYGPFDLLATRYGEASTN